MIEHILNELTSKHPAALQLVSDLIKEIDRDIRQKELAKQYPTYEIVAFDLATMNQTVKNTLENLAQSDGSPIEFDHAGRVIHGFLEALDKNGYFPATDPMPPGQHMELIQKTVEIGYEVELKVPTVSSTYVHAFCGTVAAISKDSITVEDQDGDCFHVAAEEIYRILD